MLPTSSEAFIDRILVLCPRCRGDHWRPGNVWVPHPDWTNITSSGENEEQNPHGECSYCEDGLVIDPSLPSLWVHRAVKNYYVGDHSNGFNYRRWILDNPHLAPKKPKPDDGTRKKIPGLIEQMRNLDMTPNTSKKSYDAVRRKQMHGFIQKIKRQVDEGKLTLNQAQKLIDEELDKVTVPNG